MIKIMPLMSSHRELIPEPQHAAQTLSSNERSHTIKIDTYRSN